VSAELRSRSTLEDFTVELDVYSGPYEGLLALILQDELEIFEVPLRELVTLYRSTYYPAEASGYPAEASGNIPGTLERDTNFVDSATSLLLLKGRALTPTPETEGGETDEGFFSPLDLEDRLLTYLKIRRGAEALGERFAQNEGFYPSGHALRPRVGNLRVRPDRLVAAVRQILSRMTEPEVRHLGTITVTIGELVTLIQASLTRGPLSFEDLICGMNRLHSAVAFAAALSLASEGRLILSQSEPFGPLTLEPVE
jgi:segregation and condensation protein A